MNKAIFFIKASLVFLQFSLNYHRNMHLLLDNEFVCDQETRNVAVSKEEAALFKDAAAQVKEQVLYRIEAFKLSAEGISPPKNSAGGGAMSQWHKSRKISRGTHILMPWWSFCFS